MEYNEILLTKLEQCIDALIEFKEENITLQISSTQENTKEVNKLTDALLAFKMPEDVTTTIQHRYEHKHINEGVRFMLIALISVILVSSGFSVYFYSRYARVKGYENRYELYKDNSDWAVPYFNYMYKKHVKESENYIKAHPFPK